MNQAEIVVLLFTLVAGLVVAKQKLNLPSFWLAVSSSWKQCCGHRVDSSGEIATPQIQQLPQEALRIERQTIIRLRNEQMINAEARLIGF